MMNPFELSTHGDLQWAVGRAWLAAGYERLKPGQDIADHEALARMASTHAHAAMLCARTLQ